MTAAAAVLDRPEFASFPDAAALPPARRFALPFALHAARLLGPVEALDLSAEPGLLAAPFADLCPAARLLPPDAGACDRVLCVETLDGLDDTGRESLLADAARRLRPGGLLAVAGALDPAELEAAAARHGLRTAGPAETVHLPDAVHGAVFAKGAPASVARRVALLLLGWNIRDVFLEAVEAAVREAELLARLGHEALVVVWDNGSTDGTAEALREREDLLGVPHRLVLRAGNEGLCHARNGSIDEALDWGADHVLLLDGDVEVVPGSAHAMLQALEAAGPALGTVWPDPESFATARERATPSLWGLGGRPLELVPHRLFTGYGLFRREVFERGVRFEEDETFLGVGHGFEDVDLGLQLHRAGFESRRFRGVRFLHRYPNSAVDVMRGLGVDGRAIAHGRKAHLLAKWAGSPELAGEPLEWLRRTPVW